MDSKKYYRKTEFSFPLLCAFATLMLAPAFSRAAEVFEAERIEQFQLGGRWITFVTIEKERLTLSKSCRAEESRRFYCLAYRALKVVSLKGLRAPEGVGTNPGILVCSKLRAKITVGTDTDGNENAFCEFSDGSFVDVGTLHYYARKNDEGK